MLFTYLLFFGLAFAEIDHDIVKYLNHYGFIQTSDQNLQTISEDDYGKAIRLFQEIYELPEDGKLNNETLKLIKSSRCGMRDNVERYQIAPYKWENTTTLTWYFYKATANQVKVAEKAFEAWSNHTNMKFIYDHNNPNIPITFDEYNHNCIRDKNQPCQYEFDGKGQVLAHAYPPSTDKNITEIHVDASENWWINLDVAINKSEDSIRLLPVLIHEIGHALGISHSTRRKSIMFPYIRDELTTLGKDDIRAIQYLYGRPSKKNIPTTTSTTPTSTTVRSTTTTNKNDTAAKQIIYPKLCDLNNVTTFPIVNNRLYIFFEKCVWWKRLDEYVFNQKPLLLTDWLPFLPWNFGRISGIYKKENGNIVFYANHVRYEVTFPGLQLKSRRAALPTLQNITAALKTYSGRTFIFHGDKYIMEYDDCNDSVLQYGFLDTYFSGVPNHIEGAFRYTNGRIYFFKDGNYFEYDEFGAKLVKADRFDLSLFGINCPNIGVLQQLKILVQKLLNSDA